MGHDITCVGGLEGLSDELLGKISQEQLFQWKSMEDKGSWTLFPNTGFLFRTGFAQAIAPDHGCLLWDRSGMGGSKLIHRFAGVIDEDYRGEWLVRLFNHSEEWVEIKVGDKIVQGIYEERIRANCPIVDELPETSRGIGGFGSTGD